MFKRKTTILILLFCIAKLVLHLLADFNSGFQGDELLHIETGNHPGFGYMEFPPIIGWLAFIQNQFHSSSVFINHIFAHLASLLIIVVVAYATTELGGKTKAVFIVLLCLLAAPGMAQQLFQPVVFSQLFWMLAFYQLVRFVKTPERNYFLYLAICLALGFLTKYDILFFIFGLTSLLVYKRTRDAVFASWKYGLVFLLIVIPNLWWQYQHQFPAFEMFSRLYETQLDKLTATGVVKDLIIMLNPFNAVLWIAGSLFMFNRRDKTQYRPIAVAIVLSILFLTVSKSKAYYFCPAITTLLIFGSIWLEQKILLKRKWLIYPIASLLLISGALMMPFAMAVLPLQAFIQYAHLHQENGHYKVSKQEYYAQYKWQNTLIAIQSVYDSLPDPEKRDCLIWGKHYSQAGGVNLWRESYGLPKAFSYHGSFYLWAPEGKMPATVIAFTNDEAEIDFFQQYFDAVIPVKKIYNPYASFDKDLWQTIYICKAPKQTFTDLKTVFKTRVFE